MCLGRMVPQGYLSSCDDLRRVENPRLYIIRLIPRAAVLARNSPITAIFDINVWRSLFGSVSQGIVTSNIIHCYACHASYSARETTWVEKYPTSAL
jgi:hypothetical protein